VGDHAPREVDLLKLGSSEAAGNLFGERSARWIGQFGGENLYARVT
jgi:hypothetical protein